MEAPSNTEQHRVDFLDNIITVGQFIDKYPTLLTRDRFSYYCKKKHENGLADAGAIVRVGKRYDVKEREFSRWLYRHINIYGK